MIWMNVQKAPIFEPPNIYFGDVFWLSHGFALSCQQMTRVRMANREGKKCRGRACREHVFSLAVKEGSVRSSHPVTQWLHLVILPRKSRGNFNFSVSRWSALRVRAWRLCPEFSSRTWCSILPGHSRSSTGPGKQWGDHGGRGGRGGPCCGQKAPGTLLRKPVRPLHKQGRKLSILGENLKDQHFKHFALMLIHPVRLGKRRKPTSLMPGRLALLYLLPPPCPPPAGRAVFLGRGCWYRDHPRGRRSKVFEARCLWEASANPPPLTVCSALTASPKLLLHLHRPLPS